MGATATQRRSKSNGKGKPNGTKARPPNGGRAAALRRLPLARPLHEPVAQLEAKLPPGFVPEKQPQYPESSEVWTIFLHLDRRAMRKVAEVPGVRKQLQKSFRGVALVDRGFALPALEAAKVVGCLPGDHFEAASKWAATTVLDDLHADYLAKGGGTVAERQQAQRAFLRAREFAAELEARLEKAQQELDHASEELVRRFGNQSLVIDGDGTYDPSFAPGEKVYWRRRPGQ